jgi:hypothetical protein
MRCTDVQRSGDSVNDCLTSLIPTWTYRKKKQFYIEAATECYGYHPTSQRLYAYMLLCDDISS